MRHTDPTARPPCRWLAVAMVTFGLTLGGCGSEELAESQQAVTLVTAEQSTPEDAALGAVPTLDATGAEAVMQSDGADWPDVSTAGSLAALAEVVVIAEPLAAEDYIVNELRTTDDVLVQWRARDVRVLQVLAGTAVAAGDVLAVARYVVSVKADVNGKVMERTLVGGGYPGELTGDRYILGISRDPVVDADLATWVIVAGANGLIKLESGDTSPRVAIPADGSDGQLQVLNAGEPATALIDELRATD